MGCAMSPGSASDYQATGQSNVRYSEPSVSPLNRWICALDTFGNHVANQCGLNRVSGRKPFNFAMRRVSVELVNGAQRNVHEAEWTELTADMPFRIANVQFSQTPIWAHVQTSQPYDFLQLLGFREVSERLKPLDR